jgi:hypothetical protein
MRYRLEDGSAEGSRINDYDANVKLKSKVNDSVTAIVNVEMDKAENHNTTGAGRHTIDATNAYFAYTTGSTTVNVGRQGIPGPFEDAAGGNGAIATTKLGAATIAYGFLNNTTIAGANNVVELALLANVGGVDFQAWYADADNVASVYSVSAAGKIGPVSISVAHSDKDIDNSTAANDDITLSKLVVSGKVGAATLTAGYAKSGDDNGASTTALDNDNDSGVDFKVWQASAGGFADADTVMIAAAMPMGGVTASLTYANIDTSAATTAGGTDADEILAKVVYPMSKNFSVTAMYSNLDGKVGGTTTDNDKSRLELKYTF